MFSKPMIVAARITLSALGAHVGHVVGVTTSEQMIGPYAAFDIAMVAHAQSGGDLSDGKLIGQPVS